MDGTDRMSGNYDGRSAKGFTRSLFQLKTLSIDPLAIFSGAMEFTMIAFATERDGKFEPKTICATAKRLIDRIKSGQEKVREFTFED